MKYTTESFILKASEIHGDKYDYSLTDIKNIHSKIKIICKIHGEYEQLATNHIQGRGCQKCGKSLISNKEDFIKKAHYIHNNYYNYDMVEYVNAITKVKINCPLHGQFLQSPNHHLSYKGCPSCRKSKGELIIENFLIKNNLPYKPQYSFTDLKFKSNLYFDFGVLNKDSKLEYLIEFNGEQHYRFIKRYHKDNEGFEISKLKDKKKIDYCQYNNIPLLIIRYDENPILLLDNMKVKLCGA